MRRFPRCCSRALGRTHLAQPITHATVGCFCVVFVLACSVCAQAQGVVKLLNAGFEQADPKRPGMPLGWGTYPGSATGRLEFIWDDQQARSGKRSVCIVVGERGASWLPSDTSDYATSLQVEDLEGVALPRPQAVVGHEYALSASVRGEGSARQAAVLVLRWTNESGWITSYVREYFQLEGEGWQLLTISAAAPEGAKWICPILQVRSSPEPGRIWFDDVTLVDRTGLSCEVRTPPELVGLPNQWACEVAVTSSLEGEVPLQMTLQPDIPGAKAQEVTGVVSTETELRLRAEYESAEPHRLHYSVTSTGKERATYFGGKILAPAPLEAGFVSPRYRATLYADDLRRPIKVRTRVHASEQVRSALVLHAGVRVGDKVVAEKTLPKPPASGTVELDLPGLPEGTHTIELRLQAGDEVIAKTALPLHCRPGMTPAAAIGERNELLVDGKPVFPIGFYSTFTEDFKRFKSEGFNTVLLYTSNVDSLKNVLQKADESGLKLIVSSLRPFVPKQDAEGLREAVKALADMPALLGYYLWDEPSIGNPDATPEQMRWVYEQAMAEDPSHITCIVFCAPSQIKLYRDTMDVVLVDPYPTHRGREADMSMVASWVERAREAVNDERPVWLVPQAFDHLLGPGTYRMPTIEEQRCMCYLGLVHGAKGIIWFVYSGFCIHSDEVAKQKNVPHAWVYRGSIPKCFPIRWEGIKKIVAEVNELSPVLLAEDQPQTQEILAGAQEVHCLLKSHGGQRYLFAVNAKNRPVEFSCKLPHASAEAEVMWEDRSIELRNDVLSDMFQPYEVHVYRLIGRE